jgi:hypothetical protein
MKAINLLFFFDYVNSRNVYHFYVVYGADIVWGLVGKV